MSQNPSDVVTQEVFPRIQPGYRRFVILTHPNLGSFYLQVSDANISEQNQYQFSTYTQTPPSGPKQTRIHAAGTKQIQWTVTFDLTENTIPLLSLLLPSFRGLGFSSLLIQQGVQAYSLTANSSYALPWNSISLNYQPHSIVQATIAGYSLTEPTTSIPINFSAISRPIPTWSCGNALVSNFTLSHSVEQVANWNNTTTVLPQYYRPKDSVYKLNVSTVVQLSPYTTIRVGLADLTLIEGLLQSVNYRSGSLDTVFEYNTDITNVAISDQQAYAPAATLSFPIIALQAWPTGLNR